jgi:hypothetical protein
MTAGFTIVASDMYKQTILQNETGDGDHSRQQQQEQGGGGQAKIQTPTRQSEDNPAITIIKYAAILSARTLFLP